MGALSSDFPDRDRQDDAAEVDVPAESGDSLSAETNRRPAAQGRAHNRFGRMDEPDLRHLLCGRADRSISMICRRKDAGDLQFFI